MLEFLRKSVTSWVGIGILAIALAALVITLFQPTGPTGQGADPGAVLATVGDASVTEDAYLRLVDRAVAQERERNPSLTNPDFLAAGGGDLVLRQLVAGKAIDQFGAEHGMVISKRMVDGEIASIPAFQVGGKFDDAAFRRLLAEQRISEAELRESIATDLKRRQLLQPVSLGTSVPRGMAEPFAALLLEVRRGAILVVPSALMPAPPPPTEAELAAFHAENRRAYTIPERRAFRFAEFDAGALLEKSRPTPAEVRKYYDENPAEFGALESREVNQLVLRDETRARAVVAAVRGGTPLLKAAAAEGFAAEDIRLGIVTETELADATSADVAKAAFALKSGTVGDPVQSNLGFHIVEVTRILPAAPRPFQAVAATVERKLMLERRDDLLADLVAGAEDRLADGEPLADVAKSLGLAVQSAPALTADGRLYAPDWSVSRVEQPLLPRVFAADADERRPEVAEVAPGRYMMYELAQVEQPTLVPLADVREDVALAWGIQARSDAARRRADEIAKASDGGQSLAAAAGTGLPPPQPLQVRRLELTQMSQQGQEVPPPVIMLLNTPEGRARTLAAPQGQGWFVVKVDAVEPGNIGDAPELVEAVRRSLEREAGNEMVETLVRAVERDVGVVRKPEALKAVNQRLTGAGVE
jgi:peptidyl-prolyl cis-trans isomerase D